jgi:hypothetical protein
MAKIMKVIQEGLVQEVPPEYDACESCRETTCSAERAATCPNRSLPSRKEVLLTRQPT